MLDKLSGKELPNHVMLVVRQDIYADIHILFSSISDPTHMDSQPRVSLWMLWMPRATDTENSCFGGLMMRDGLSLYTG